jgi:IS5 family transposase
LFQETIAAAQRENLLRRSDASRAIVDTTIMEKAIAFPTDARLYQKARRTLVREAKREEVLPWQSLRAFGEDGVHASQPVRSCTPRQACTA